MNITREGIANICDDLLRVYDEGHLWLTENVSDEMQLHPSLELRRLIKKMRTLQAAALRRPTTAVFGASQMGKSYLISNLVKSPETSDLLITDPQTKEKISFIKEMNPFGSKESTGTVTRFTTSPAASSGEGYAIRLLSPKDLACIILNGYYKDIKSHTYEPSLQDLSEKMLYFNSRKQDTPTGIFQEDDFHEIKYYAYKKLGLGTNTIISRFTEYEFWQKASQVAPYLSLNDSVELCGFLWGKRPFLSDLFQRLLHGLQTVDFNIRVFCDKQALTSNKETILDVQRVRELYTEVDASSTSVNVTTTDRRQVFLDRRILAALTAEVELPLSLDPENIEGREFLSYADVLDFPGARSREHVPEIVFIENTNEAKLQLFVRGKVSYLFDLYNEDFGISSLLYCMDDSNPEVQNLPSLLYHWIANTVGGSPEERERRMNQIRDIVEGGKQPINPLMVVLTKFDIELAGKPSEIEGKPETHDGKWVARLEENFKNFMLRPLEDKWVTNWSLRNKMFNNVFPLYNPTYPNPVFDKDENEVEVEVSKAYKIKLADMKTSFINHPIVQSHIREPKYVWDQVATPGSSGLNYIIKYLTPTCKPEIKLASIKGAVRSINEEVTKLLQEYFNPEDVEELIKRAHVNGVKTIFYLTKITKENRFGNFLEKLLITENEAYSCYFDVQNSPVLAANGKKPLKNELASFPKSFLELLEDFGIDPTLQAPELIKQLEDSFQLSLPELEEIIESTIKIPLSELVGSAGDQGKAAKNTAMVFADKIIAFWINKIQELKRSSSPSEDSALAVIIDELIKTRERVGLRRILYDAVRDEVENFSVNGKFDIVARITFQILNNFINTFGWCFVDERDRPKDKEGAYLFSQLPIDPKIVVPSISQKFPGQKIYSHWSTGAKEAYLTNVYYENEVKKPENLELNRKLGGLLNHIKEIAHAIQ